MCSLPMGHWPVLYTFLTFLFFPRKQKLQNLPWTFSGYLTSSSGSFAIFLVEVRSQHSKFVI